jgi:hypothetical protein
MTANFLSYIEIKAYSYAHKHKCIPERESGRIAIPELFDMVAGSETGAIIGASLLVPN